MAKWIKQMYECQQPISIEYQQIRKPHEQMYKGPVPLIKFPPTIHQPYFPKGPPGPLQSCIFADAVARRTACSAPVHGTPVQPRREG